MNYPRLAFFLFMFAAACGDPLVDPQTVIGLRILGAKLSAAEDPSVAQVAPGGSATLSWLVVAERERDFRALTLFCQAEPGTFGVPRCGPRFLEQRTESSTDSPVAFSFSLPDDYADEQEWLSFLALCEDGEPRWSKQTQRFSCTSGDQPITGFYRGIARNDANHNPDLQDDELRFNGDIWSATDSAAPTCDEKDVPRVRSDEVVPIRLVAKGTDSEALDDASYAAASHEALTYTHVTTSAGLSRAFSAIDPTTKSKRFELELAGEDAWAEEDTQRVATFYLVVSDGRGGSDWLLRHYCVAR